MSDQLSLLLFSSSPVTSLAALSLTPTAQADRASGRPAQEPRLIWDGGCHWMAIKGGNNI